MSSRLLSFAATVGKNTESGAASVPAAICTGATGRKSVDGSRRRSGASAEVRALLLEIAAKRWKVPVDSLQVSQGIVRAAHGAQGVPSIEKPGL